MGIRTARDRFDHDEIVEILKRNVALYKDDPEFAEYFVALTMYLLDQHYDEQRISPSEPPYPPRMSAQPGVPLDLRSAYLDPRPAPGADPSLTPPLPQAVVPASAPRPPAPPSSPAVAVPGLPPRGVPVVVRPGPGPTAPGQPAAPGSLTPPPVPGAPPSFQVPQGGARPYTVRPSAPLNMPPPPPPPPPSPVPPPASGSSGSIRKSGVIQMDRGPLTTPLPSLGPSNRAPNDAEGEKGKGPDAKGGQSLGQTKVYRVVRPYKSTTALEVPCSVCGSLVGFGVKQCPGCGHVM